MKTTLLCLVLLCHVLFAKAQILSPVKWSFGSKRINSSEAIVFMKAVMDDGWHIYSQTVPPNGPSKTAFTFTASRAYNLLGDTQEPTPITRFEKVFGFKVAYFENSVIFQQKIKLNTKGPATIKGNLEFQTCNDEKCIQPTEVPFSVSIK